MTKLEKIGFKFRKTACAFVRRLGGYGYASRLCVDAKDFKWTAFYEALGRKLAKKASTTDRAKLVHHLNAAPQNLLLKEAMKDTPNSVPLSDICPFTTISLFNRSTGPENRRDIAKYIGEYLKVRPTLPNEDSGVPNFNGVPEPPEGNSRLFADANVRKPSDIQTLWNVYIAASRYVQCSSKNNRDEFVDAYNKALKVRMTKWNLAIGLFWAFPWNFPPLDRHSRVYIEEELGITVSDRTQNVPPTGDGYLKLVKKLNEKFESDDCKVRSFPRMSREARLKFDGKPSELE